MMLPEGPSVYRDKQLSGAMKNEDASTAAIALSYSDASHHPGIFPTLVLKPADQVDVVCALREFHGWRR